MDTTRRSPLRYWKDAACVVLFAIIAWIYFYPAASDGRKIEDHDHTGGIGLGTEINEYRSTHDGEDTRWTNVAFSGMPTYQIAPSYPSGRALNTIASIYHLGLPEYVFYIFISLLGFYILMRAFDFKEWMAALGAIVWAFSTYFLIIIAAGHIWKVLTLAYIPPTIAGIVLCYKGKYLWGGIVTALFGALQIISNHVQMSYYFLFLVFFMVVAYFIDAWRKKQLPHFFKATAILIVGGMLAVAMNLSNLFHTYEYAKETMRGKSELVKQGKTDDQTDSGLERSYITQWSYGIGETLSLLVPNINGGASAALSENSISDKPEYNHFNGKDGMYGANLYDFFTQYWGKQPGTSGPVYAGAFVCLLFVLSLFIISNKNPLKWALLAATLLSILMAWGKNFMGFTDWLIDYMPMYSKFRTVSSALVVAEFTIPMLAMLALREFIIKVSGDQKQQALRQLGISTLITGGIVLMLALFPSIMGNGMAERDTDTINQLAQQGFQEGAALQSTLQDIRLSMLSSDAWRSLIIILIGSGLMWWYAKRPGQFKMSYLGVGLFVLCLIDLWQVNKRYLNDKMFTTPSISIGDFTPSAADQTIFDADQRNMEGLQLDDLQKAARKDYRVANLATNIFNDNSTSRFHKSIGGYHPAKLRRYQELIEEHIGSELSHVGMAVNNAQEAIVGDSTGTLYATIADNPANMLALLGNEELDKAFPVLNMLNTRWFILGTGQGPIAIKNPAAYGNAWFVGQVEYVKNANEELSALHNVSPRQVAVVDEHFKETLGQPVTLSADSSATIMLDTYEPNRLTYKVNSQKGGLVVFSEIYYPDWTATIDDQPAQIGRADYVLRAMNVPAGQHTIVMTFDPPSVHTTETIAYVALSILALAVVVAIVWTYRKRKTQEQS